MKKVVRKSTMKKFVSAAAITLMLGAGSTFVSCSDDSSSDEETPIETPEQNNNAAEEEKKDNENNNGNNGNENNNNNGGENNETPAVEVVFSSLNFDSAELKNYAADTVTEDFVSADGLWKIVHGVSKSTATVSESKATSYNEDTEYNTRIQMKLGVLKLKVGANKTVTLRVDGGSASGSGSDRTLSCGDAKWTSFKGSADGKVCAGFLTVTGDADGWVTLSADNNINVYGVKVVEAAEDLSAVVLGKSIVYSAATANVSSEDIKTGDEVTVSASTKATATPLYANGLTGDAEEPVDVTDFAFYNGETKLKSNVVPTTESGSYEIKAVLLVDGVDAEGNPAKVENTKVTATVSYDVVDANAASYTVTYDIDGTKTTESVYDGFAPAEVPASPTKEGYIFKSWSSSVEGLTTESVITSDVTFTAVFAKACTVTFNSNGGKEEESSVAIEENTTVENIPVVTYAGYDFAGWATEKDATSANWTDETKVTENITVYAVWVKSTVKAGTYNLTSKGLFKAQSVGTTSSASGITITSKIDSTGSNVYGDAAKGTITFEITSDMTLTMADSNSKGIAISTTDGEISSTDTNVTVVEDSKSAKTSASNASVTVSLKKGSYTIMGANSKSATKIAELVFAAAE